MMTKRKHKTLLTLLICAALIGTGSAASAAVTSQADADRVDSALASGSYEITDSYTRQDRRGSSLAVSIGQVFSQNGSIVINERGSADHTLKMSLDANVAGTPSSSNIANILSDAADRTVTVKNLSTLNLALSGERILESQPAFRGNLTATKGGTVIIDNSVQSLEASSVRVPSSVTGARPPAFSTDSNILALGGSTVKVLSPTVKLYVEAGFESSNTSGNHTRGIMAQGCSHIVMSQGSGTGEGLFLTGDNIYQSYGITATGNAKSQVDMISGNLTIDKFFTSAESNNGVINLGTASSPVSDIVIKNAQTGMAANHDGAIEVHARNLTMTDNIQSTAIVSASNGKVELHTSGTAFIHGKGASPSRTSVEVINSYGGHIAVNADPNDGATKLIGIVESSNGGTTHLGFHTPDSYFIGHIYDRDDGKTTAVVSNQAEFILAQGTTSTDDGVIYNSFLDTLDVSGTGKVYAGTKGLTYYYENGYGKSRIANLKGNGGTFIFRTDLQESADRHTVNGHSDQLILANSSSGTHDIMIDDHSNHDGGLASDGYVLLIKDQSARPGAIFRGRADLQNGGLFAQPVEITNQAPDPSEGYTDVPESGNNWYLRMAREQPEEPVKPTWNAKNNVAFARSRYSALWIEQDTLRQRVGELRNHTQDDGVWARIDRGEYSMNGVNGNADYIRYHIGYDKQIGSQKGQKQYIGMAYHHTDTDLNYRHFTDDSDMDADIGTIYYTNLQDKGHYLDIVGKFGRMKGKMKTFGEFPESAKWDSPFYSLSAEYGRKVMYKNDWYVEPQAQLTYSHLGSDSYLTSQGTHAHVDGINSLIFRTGFTVGKKDGQNEYYGKVFWHHEFEGAEDARFHDKNDDSLRDSYDFGGSWVTVGFGGQIGIGKDAYLYGDVDKSFGGDVKKKWAWNMGVRFGF